MNANFFKSYILLLTSLLMFGCQTAVTPRAETTALKPAAVESAVASVGPTEFTEQQLYDLLVGELAGVRGDVPLALEKYSQQAFAMREPQLAERAARIASFSNRPAQVLKHALLWSELSPDNSDARRMAALALARNGDFVEALRHAEYTLLQGDSEPLMTLTILVGRASQKDRLALLGQFEKLEISAGKNNFWVLLAKSMLLRSANQLKAAQQSSVKALKLMPDSETAALLVSQIYHQQGDKKKALNSLKRSLKHNPDSKRLHIQQVRFVANDNLMAARELLSDLIQRYPKDVQFALSHAQLHFELGLIDDARRAYLRLLQNPVVASQARYYLGLLEQQQGNIDQAISYLRLVRNQKLVIPIAARVSAMLSATDRVETARLYLQELRRKNPAQASTLFQIESEMLIDKALPQVAYGMLNEAITTFPANIALLYTRSLVGEQLENFEQAELDLRSIIALDENNAMALNALGYTLTLHTNRYQEAHQLIVRALALEPEDPATLDSLGWVLFHMHRYDEAIIPLEKAWQKMQDAEIAAHLGEVYWAAGRQQDAEVVWERILVKDPENTMILKAIKRLKQFDSQ